MAKLRESFWFIPAVLGVVALVLAQALVSLDRICSILAWI